MSTDDARPAGVPDGAVWNQGDREWELAELDAEGHKHGVTRWWRPDGTLCCTTDYVDGLAHGVFRRTHENGEPSRTGRFERGVLHGTNVFVRSTAATTEVFPPGVGAGVWTVEMDYDRGKIVEARAYDRLGNRVTDDGSPFPTERPEGVPTAATFRKREADRQWRWVHGQVIDRNDGTIARVGQWRFWTPDGVLVADEWYAEGKLHGTVATFDPETGAALELTAYRDGARHGPSEKRDPSGRVIARVEYTDGKATGAFEREAEPGRYHDPRAVIERGTQVDGDVATLTLADAAGAELVTITMSAKVDQRVLSDVLGGDLPSLSTITALDQSGQRTVAFLAAALAGVDPAALRERLAAFRPPLTEESRQRQTYSAKMVASNVVRFGGRPVAVLSSLLNGIREGGDPAELLRQAAASIDDHGDSELASRLIDVAVALDPENTGHEYTRALVRMSLGDPDGAAASIARLDGPFVNAVPSLDAYRRALFSDLGAWVDDDPRLALALRVAPLLGRTTLRAAPPAALVERTIHQGITRLLHART
ncbi:MAG: hypothetical protein ABMB14_37995, partial [Myxococcota bacterium]